MYEFQFSLSLNGKFQFRTDWENDRERADEVEKNLRTRFTAADGWKIRCSFRSPVMNSYEVEN